MQPKLLIASSARASRPAPLSINNIGLNLLSIIGKFKGLIFGLFLLALWQALGQIGWIDTVILPLPSSLLETFWSVLRNGMLIKNIDASLIRVLTGFMIAAVLGVSFGALLGGSRRLAETVMPVIEFIRPIPPIAWIPIAILWFGIGNGPAYFVVFIGAIFPIFINTFTGVRAVDPTHVNAARSLGASRWLLVSRVLLPAALPTIMTGLRLGLGIAWACVVAAELIAAQSGLGYLIEWYRQLLNTEIVMVGMITIGILGLLMNYIMLFLEHLLLPWHHTTHK